MICKIEWRPSRDLLIWDLTFVIPSFSPADTVEQQDNGSVVVSPPRRAVPTVIAHPQRRTA